MSNISPEEARHNPEKAAEATHESSGYSIEGDTPPGEGLGVGPTNHAVDVDPPGEGARNKLWLVLTLALVAVFVLLAIIGSIVRLL